MTGVAAPAPALAAGAVRLGPWSDDDADDVLRLADDEQTRASSPSLRRLRTRADALAWLAGRRRPGRVEWVARDAASGTVVGRVGLRAIDEEQRCAEIGYAVAAGWRGRGLARAMVDAVTAHAFTAMGLARVTLVHAVDNRASCAVARACGYAVEGVERAALDHGDGVRHDAHRHARLWSDPPGPLPPPPVPLAAVELVAGVLQLRPWEQRFADAVLAASADPEIRLWNDPGVRDADAARAWVERACDWGTHATWAVHHATTGEVLGNVSLHRVEPAHSRAEVGYWVLPAARGHGVATAALAAATRFAFGALGLHRVELYHAVDNVASCRAAQRAGFVVEGVVRSGYRYGDGVLRDEHLHGRLATDLSG